MLPYLEVFSKAAFISPVLFSDLVANKDSTKYLIMVNGILVTGDSPWDRKESDETQGLNMHARSLVRMQA